MIDLSGNVFFTTDLSNSRNYLYVIDEHGILKWRYGFNNTIYSGPTISTDGYFYFGSAEYTIGDNGVLKHTLPNVAVNDKSPLVGADHTLYFSSGAKDIVAMKVRGNADKHGAAWLALGGNNQRNGRLNAPDTDLDGVVDIIDNCPQDSNADQLNTDNANDGGNACDTDDDNDGVEDSVDVFPLDSSETLDSDGDGTGNNADLDDDNDGVVDTEDAFPLDASESLDTDGDGIGNNADLDDDNDGVMDVDDDFPLDSEQSTFKLISDVTLNDVGLASCVMDLATAKGWTTVNEVTQLACASKNISDLTGLNEMFALTTLDLRKNSISDITILSDLTALTQVKLAKNAISDLSPLASLSALTFVSLSANQFDNAMLQALSDLSNLSVLYLRDNGISDLTALANLTHLTRLYLNNNQVESVSALFNLSVASRIDLRGNNTVNCVELEALVGALGDGIVIAPASCTYIGAVEFADVNLGQCVLETAGANNWLTVGEVTTLACPSKAIVD
ncbi:MAG: leucine-rich repeat domain-containing protein, partial [Psychrosphaera sp.]|nr:leucine-rich repeat domain-containing protein [Psychrosphaera sp.]